MNLAGQSLKFENGQWVAESGSFTGDRREMQRLRKRNQQLEEENNLLRLKVDILLDMLSETTAESHLMEKELEELKSHSRRRKFSRAALWIGTTSFMILVLPVVFETEKLQMEQQQQLQQRQILLGPNTGLSGGMPGALPPLSGKI
ncbi:Protein chibby-like protein 1 [Anas platyrhynchos]|uniref:Mitochondrial import receptor subunit TOM22 homolog n=1 Tax=Anas platyrhynchos TaxID=8839 RepID=R0K1W1_ANAPL|nr:Protein chibby-like protein 1 [Anas platyrhynchos]